jgi:signal transduction histidine kinase
MNDLMEDVLTIGRAQSKKIEEVEETDFVTFVRNTLGDIQESYNFDTQATLDVIKTPSTFYSNESALKHIVSNLITNALKYTTNGQNTHITIDEQDGNIVFVVADKGIGIPPDDMKRLFTNFHRAKNVGKIAGTGLGLHIVKQSVENLFGTIDVESEVNVGTTFTVKLPLDIRDKIAAQSQEEES